MKMEKLAFQSQFSHHNIEVLCYIISMLPSSSNQMGLQYLFIGTILHVVCGLDRYLELVDDFHHSV